MSELVASWVVTGALVGLAVYLFSRRRLPGGFFGNVVVGVLGATLGGYLVTTATHTDIARSTLTWGILAVSAVSALIAGVIAQTEARTRSK